MLFRWKWRKWALEWLRNSWSSGGAVSGFVCLIFMCLIWSASSQRSTSTSVPIPPSSTRPQTSGASEGSLGHSVDQTEFKMTDNSITSVQSSKKVVAEQDEKILLRYLMNGYESDVRPVRNASNPVLIQVGITLTQIFDMDEKNQVLTTNVWLDQEWNDELLRWDPADYNGLSVIRLPCRLIWLPDVVLYNNADDYERGYMPSRAMVSHDGNVFWPPPTKFRSTCPVDVTYFPFDDQVCRLKLASWAYNSFQVDITNRTATVDLSNYVENGEWELLDARLERNVVYYSCCPEPFPDVTITLVIRRKTLYYIYNVVLPCMMLSILTLLVFCLPPDSGEKVALGITVLLAFSVFMLAIAEKMPETSTSIPLIGIYLTAVMAITSISVIVTVVVLNLHYLGPRVQPIPSWLRSFLPQGDIDFLSEKSLLLPHVPKAGNRRTQQVYLVSTHRPNQRGPMSYSTSVPPTPITATNNNTSAQNRIHHLGNHVKLRRRVNSQEFEPIDEEVGMTHALGDEMDESSTDSLVDDKEITAKPQRVRNSPHHKPKSKVSPHHKRLHRINNTSTKHNSSPPAAGAGGAGSGALKIQEELLKSIQHLLKKQEDLEFQNLLVAEWRLVAQVIDRILFWIFFIITIASSGVFLVILPLYKRHWNDPH